MKKKVEILNYWNQRFKDNGILSAGYTDKLIQKIDDKNRWKSFIREVNLKRGESILDAGCNYGYWSLRLAKLGMIVTGIDIIDEAIKVAKNNAKKAFLKINFQKIQVENLDFGNNKFDKIISITVLQHILNDRSYLKSLKNFNRQLKGKGELIMIESAPNKRKKEKLSFKRERTFEDQVKYCSKAGFKLIKLKGIYSLSAKWYYGIQKFGFSKKTEKYFQVLGIKILNPIEVLLTKFSFLAKFSNLKLMIFKKI